MYAAYRHIPVGDIAAPVPGSAQAAQLPDRGASWAMIRFLPSARAPLAVAVGFQDGGGAGVFTRAAGGGWRIAGLGGEPLGCAAGLPAPVRRLWRLAGCPVGTPQGRTRPAAASTEELALIAEDQVGVGDTPAETSFSGLDCNPYTALEAPGGKTAGCGTDPTFHLKDASELWCSDFAKWVWAQGGVTSDLSVLNPLASSFYTWGRDHGEPLPVDGTNPKVGDAVVFYPAGTKPSGGNYADHVGLVTGIGPGGQLSMVNGDFLGASNITVQADTGIQSLKSWAAGIWGAGEQWVFVAPKLSTAQRSPAAAVDQRGNSYVVWRNATDGGLDEAIYTASSQAWSGPTEITVNGHGMGPLGSAPAVAVGSAATGANPDQYVFWEGTDRRLWEARWNGSWHGPKAIADGPLGSAPTAGMTAKGTIYVFWQNARRGLEQMSGNGSSWSAPRSIRVAGHGMGPLGSSPSVAVSAGGDRQVFWAGADGNLWEAWWNGSWHGPANLRGGPLGSPPSVAVGGTGARQVFWSAVGGSLREAFRSGSSWSRAQIAGMGPLRSAPTATVTRAGNPRVYWKGAGSDLWQARESGSSWLGPTDDGFGPLG
jgi:hypothetical protein